MDKSNTKLKLSFSGHETFHCRQQWLKKGYDFVAAGRKFSEEDAVVELGVGKNMVSAIHFWMKAFRLVDTEDGSLTDLAHYIFGPQGKDPFLEDNASLWLLHHQLVTSNIASIYSLVFNELRREKIEFTKDNFAAFAERKAAEAGLPKLNLNTLATDFDVLVKMYLRTSEQAKDKEDTFSGLLTELNLLQEETRKVNDKSITFYSVINDEKNELPDYVFLYAIVSDEEWSNSINLSTIEKEKNQAGSVFAISKSGIATKLENIIKSRTRGFRLILNDHAGIRELQTNRKPGKFEILEIYYG